MFLEESLWIKDKLQSLNLNENNTIIDIGSSSLQYRTVEQPYIYNNVFLPLVKNGCKITYLDHKNKEGIDFVYKIEDLSNLKQNYDVVICTNLLEHIKDKDRERLIGDLVHLTKIRGHILVTVPYDFVCHKDPIDTMFRPSNKELESLFSKFNNISFIASEIIETPSAIFHLNRLRAAFDILRGRIYHVSCLFICKEDVN